MQGSDALPIVSERLGREVGQIRPRLALLAQPGLHSGAMSPLPGGGFSPKQSEARRVQNSGEINKRRREQRISKKVSAIAVSERDEAFFLLNQVIQ